MRQSRYIFINKIFVITLFLFVTLMMLTSCGAPKYDFDELDNHNTPSIDFIQPWAFCNKNVDELSLHFLKLKENGFDAVIIQNTANNICGKPDVCYYESNTSYPKYYPNFLSNVITAAKEYDIKIIAGICSDDYWWDYGTHKYNDEMMDMLYNQETSCIEELLKYDIDGLYYSNEMYSNPKGFEKQWTKHLNNLLNYLNIHCPTLPLVISPFNSSAFAQNNDSKIRMWDRFFKSVNFRENDLFLLQDGFGNLSSNPTNKQCENLYKLNYNIRNCCLANSKANFALNIEYFAKDGYASANRMELQTKYANMLGNKIACFSYSHYFILNN